MSSPNKYQIKRQTCMNMDDVNGIVHNILSIPTNDSTPARRTGLVVVAPSTPQMIHECALYLLHDTITTSRELPNNVHKQGLNGLVIVTTHEREKVWNNRNNATVTNKEYYLPFTVLTYDTIGQLRSYSGLQNNIKLLIVFEDADNLIGLLRRDPSLQNVIRTNFHRKILFAANVPFVDLRPLLLLTVNDDTYCKFPSNEAAISDRYESTKTALPTLFKRMVADPAQKMMVHFLLVFFVLTHMSKLFTSTSKRALDDKYNDLLHPHTRRNRNRNRNRGETDIPRTQRGPKPKAHGGFAPTRKMVRTSRCVSARTCSRTIRHTRKPQGGMMFLAPVAIPYLLSGGFLLWLVSGQYTLSTIISELLMFVVMFIPNVLTGIDHFLKRKEIREMCFRVKLKLRIATTRLYKLNQLGIHASGFTSVWGTIQSVVSGVARTFFGMNRDDSAMAVGVFAFLCFMWIMSNLIQHLFTPEYTKKDKDTVANGAKPLIESDLKDYVYLSPTSEPEVNHTREKRYTHITKKHVPYTQDDLKLLLQETISCADASTTSVVPNVHHRLTQINIGAKSERCLALIKARHNTQTNTNKNTHFLVVGTDPKDDDTTTMEQVSYVNMKPVSYVTLSTLKSLSLLDIVSLGKQPPVHEIHFITPPTSHELELVTTLFAGDLDTGSDTSENTLKVGPLKITFDATSKTQAHTKLFEYVRRFEWFGTLRDSTVTTKKAKKAKMSATDWFDYTLSEMKSPEERVREHRRNISVTWRKLGKCLSTQQLDYSGMALIRQSNDYDQNQKRLLQTTHDDIVRNLAEQAKRELTEYKESDEERMGKLVRDITFLKETMKQKKDATIVHSMEHDAARSTLMIRLQKLLQPFDNTST
jgi:hypothetical protein